MVRLGRSLGLAEAVLGELDLLRPQRGRVRGSSSGFRFSPRASQLWRFALGSNAAVIKKIRNGGTTSGRELAAQMDYLFSSATTSSGTGSRIGVARRRTGTPAICFSAFLPMFGPKRPR